LAGRLTKFRQATSKIVGRRDKNSTALYAAQKVKVSISAAFHRLGIFGFMQDEQVQNLKLFRIRINKTQFVKYFINLL